MVTVCFASLDFYGLVLLIGWWHWVTVRPPEIKVDKNSGGPIRKRIQCILHKKEEIESKLLKETGKNCKQHIRALRKPSCGEEYLVTKGKWTPYMSQKNKDNDLRALKCTIKTQYITDSMTKKCSCHLYNSMRGDKSQVTPWTGQQSITGQTHTTCVSTQRLNPMMSPITGRICHNGQSKTPPSAAALEIPVNL